MAAPSSTLDRTGVFASVLCAIHCAAAPLVLLALPTLGGLWSHPISHLAMGALIVPVAFFALRSGLKTHGRRWIPVLGVVGVSLVLAAAVLPYLGTPATADAASCTDTCCPSLVQDEETGSTQLSLPMASIASVIGGLLLVVAHLSNIRCCSVCRSAASIV